MSFLGRLFDALVEAMGGVSAVLLALLTLGITAEIVVRGFGIGSLPWMIEAVEYSLLAITFLGAPWVLKRSAHVSVDIAVEQLSDRSRQVTQIVGDVIGIVVCGVILFYGLKSTIRLYELDTRIFKVMTVKEWWLFSLVPLSCAVMILEFVRRIFRRRQSSHQTDQASF